MYKIPWLILAQTVSTFSSFFLAMVRHPHAQKMAQAELDRVIGFERLPTLEDRVHLPYTNAILKEVVRRFPPIPAGKITLLRQWVQDTVLIALQW